MKGHRGKVKKGEGRTEVKAGLTESIWAWGSNRDRWRGNLHREVTGGLTEKSEGE